MLKKRMNTKINSDKYKKCKNKSKKKKKKSCKTKLYIKKY